MNYRSALFAALCCLLEFDAAWADDNLDQSTRILSDEWSEIFYHQPENRQAEQFKALLPRIKTLQANHPHHAEPLILEAITLCTLAASEWGISSLSRLNEARRLLIESIDVNPKAMGASAYITLGNLYFRLPGWPISYGDHEQARQYLEAGVKLYPHGLDSNYFLGDYWLSRGEYDKALFYLEKADQAPIRPHQRLSDTRIKQELEQALAAARKHEKRGGDFFSHILPDIGE
ncbi:MAG: hypothetical protein PHE55_19585 [Methylococcaceae bacterium]|nr:hypothetical protein [Methylococcaceae bacterium]